MADASVKVVVDAVTEKAEKNFEQTGDKIRQIGTKARVAARGVATLEGQARQLAAAGRLAAKAVTVLGNAMRETSRHATVLIGVLRRIGNAARSSVPGINALTRNVDELGDQSTQTAAQLGVLQGAMFALADATDTNIHGAKLLTGAFAALGPVIAGLVAAFVPLVGIAGVAATALGGVALGMAAIVGSAIVAELKKIKQAMAAMVKEVRKIVAAFGKQFVPLIMDAIRAFPTLVQRILDAIVGLNKFKRALRDMGQAAMTIIPAIVHEMTRLGAMAIPLLRDLAGWLRVAIPKAFNAALRVTKSLGNEFVALGKASVGLVQQLFRIGTVVLNALVPALTKLIKLLNHVFRLFTSPPPQLEAMLLRLVSALKKVRSRSQALWMQVRRLVTQLTRFSIIVGGVAVDIVARLMPAITKIIGALASLVNWVNDGMSSFIRWAARSKQLRAALRMIRGAVGVLRRNLIQLLNAIRPLLPDFKQLAKRAFGAAVAFMRWVRDSKTLATTLRILGRGVRQVTKFARSLWTTGIRPLLPSFAQLRRLALRALKTFNRLAQGELTLRKVTSLLRKGFNRLVNGIYQVIRSVFRFIKGIDQVQLAIKQVRKTIRPLIRMLQQSLAPALKIGVAGAAISLATIFRGPLLRSFNLILGRVARFFNLIPRLVFHLGRLRTWVGSKLITAFTKLRGVLGRVGAFISRRLIAVFGRAGFWIQKIARFIGGRLIFALTSLGSTLVGLLPSLGTVASSLAIFIGPQGLLILLAAAVVALYIAWKKNLYGIRNVTKRVLNAIVALIHGDTSKMKSLVGDAVNKIQGAWKTLNQLWKTAKRIFNIIVRVITNAMSWILTNIIRPILNSIMKHWNQHGQELIESVKELMGFLKKIIKLALGIIIVFWRHFGDEVLTVVKFWLNAIGSFINFWIDFILTAFDVMTDILSGDIKGALSKVFDFWKRTFNGIIAFVSRWIDNLIDLIAGLIGSFIDLFLDLWNRLVGGSIIPNMLSDIINAILSWDIAGAFRDQIQDAISAVKGFVGNFIDAGQALIGGLINGIQDKIQDLKNAVGNLTSIIGKYMPGSDAEQGALSRLSEFGPTIVRMIAEGMLSNLATLERAVARVARTALPPMLAASGIGGGGTLIDVGGIRVRVDGDRDGDDIGRDIARGLDDELRSRGFNN